MNELEKREEEILENEARKKAIYANKRLSKIERSQKKEMDALKRLEEEQRKKAH